MKILLVQTSYLGDTILSTPVITGIKTLFPDARLWVLTTPAGRFLLQNDPAIEGVISFHKRGRHKGGKGLWQMARTLRVMRFDRVYALQRSYRTALLLFLARIPLRIGFTNAKLPFLFHQKQHRNPIQYDVLRNLAILGDTLPRNCQPLELRLFPPMLKEVSLPIRNILSNLDRYIVLVPGSAWKTKMWHWEHYRKLAEKLTDLNFGVLLLGNENEKPVCNAVSRGLGDSVMDLAGKTSVDEAMVIIRQATAVVCNDSMSLHLASAFKKPTVTIFCSTSPGFGFGPWANPGARVVECNGLACKPCGRHGHQRCPLGTEECMRLVSPERVMKALQAVISR